MLTPELVELMVLLAFGPAVGAFLVLRTNAADWVAPAVRQPFEAVQDRFFPTMVSEETAQVIRIPSERLGKAV